MSSPHWTWLDKTLVGYTVLGALAIIAGLAVHRWLGWNATYSLLLLGGIVLFQGVLFLAICGLSRRSAQQQHG